MGVIEIRRDPSRRELTQFGFVWLGVFVLFAVVAWLKWRSPTVSGVLAAAAVLVPVIGWLAPAFMRLVFLGLSYAAFPIGWVVSHVILALVYYVVLTPIGLTMRLLGRDPMIRGFDRDAPSYWIQRPRAAAKPARYFRQF